MRFTAGVMSAFAWLKSSFSVVACLAACDCGSNDEMSGPKTVTFSHDIVPIFQSNCNSCHHPGNATAVDLTHPFDPATGIVNRPNTWTNASAKLIVDPGNVANSFLIRKVEATDLNPEVEGERMPWNVPRLTAEEIASVRQWIQSGANNDAFYQSTIVLIFGDGVSLGSTSGKCAFCHYPGTGNPPDLTHPFDPAQGVVNVMGVHGKLVIPGDPDGSILVQKVEAQAASTAIGQPMPYQFNPLSQAQVDTLKSWVTAGAPND